MELGSGSFGKVIEEGEYAIKTIRNKYPLSGIREVLFLSECDHPNVVKMVNIRIADSITIVMEKWDMSLRDYLTLYPCPHIDTIDRIMRNVLSAIDHIHSRGIIHADVKPGNILIDNAANRLALCDFGASVLNSTQEKSCIIQSRIYRAPEVNTRGILSTYGFPIDMWGFGCTLYRLCAGSDLFHDSADDTTIDLSHIFMVYRSTRPSRLDRLNLLDKNKVAGLLGGKIAHIVGSNRLNSLIKSGIFDIMTESLIPNVQVRITSSAALVKLGEKISVRKRIRFDLLSDEEEKFPQLVNLIRDELNISSNTDEMLIRGIAASIFSNECDSLATDEKIDLRRLSELLSALITH